ncbi:diguanylate cyclase domain-containing protein [Pseudomonadota bacterium]
MKLQAKFNKKAIGIISIAVLISITIILFGNLLGTRISTVENQWQLYNQRSVENYYALSRIQSRLGYGGFIHNFKNFLLRSDPSLIPLIEEDLKAIYESIDKYESIENKEYNGEIPDDVMEPLIALRKTVDRYSEKFVLLRTLIEEGHPKEYIDKRVKVDDTPALDAIDELGRHVIEHGKEQEDRTARALLGTIKFMEKGGIIIPFILLTAGLMVVFLRQVLHANRDAESALDYADQVLESTPDTLLVTSRDGRIVRANAEAVRLLGYCREELIKLRVEDLLPEAFRNYHPKMRQATFEHGLEGGKKTRGDFVTVTQDGKHIPVGIGISFATFKGERQAIVSLTDISERKRAEEEIKKSQMRYRALLDSAFQFIVLLDRDGLVLDANNSSLSFSNLDKSSIIGQPYWETDGWRQDAELQARIKKAIREASAGHVVRFQVMQRAVDEAEHYIDYSISPVRDAEGNITWLVSEGRDITDLHEARERLRLTEKVFDDAAEAILVTDKRKRIVDVNPSFSSVTGYERDELLGMTPHVLSSGRHDKTFYKALWTSLKNQSRWQGEIWDKRKNGDIFPARVSISTVKDKNNDVSHYVAVLSDITTLKENELKLEKLAHYDQLTKLANRTLFFNRLDEEISRAKRENKYLAVMYIDLDGFKQVNDTLGHEAGDAVLKEASTRLSANMRPYDVAARLGGDEFAVILTALDSIESASVLAERTVKTLQISVEGTNPPLLVSCSVGVSVFPYHGDSCETLLRCADEAMYAAKQQGKNIYKLYNPEKLLLI